MRFYDRIKELKLLSDVELLSHQEAQMTVLIGRRRIGKTELALKIRIEKSISSPKRIFEKPPNS